MMVRRGKSGSLVMRTRAWAQAVVSSSMRERRSVMEWREEGSGWEVPRWRVKLGRRGREAVRWERREVGVRKMREGGVVSVVVSVSLVSVAVVFAVVASVVVVSMAAVSMAAVSVAVGGSLVEAAAVGVASIAVDDSLVGAVAAVVLAAVAAIRVGDSPVGFWEAILESRIGLLWTRVLWLGSELMDMTA